MTYPADVVALTKALVAIPSHVDEVMNERPCAEYLKAWAAEHLPWMTAEWQEFAPGRSNLLLKSDPALPQLLLAGHIDTVPPAQQPKPTKGTIHGRGSTDMKGGLAALLIAAREARPRRGLWILCYGDEEYYFVGMRAFLRAYPKLKPQFALIPEPTNCKVWDSVRGVVEVEFTVRGKSAHAARPASGQNAITITLDAIAAVREWLADKTDPILGATTFNVAGIEGGTIHPERGIHWQPNMIADHCRVLLELRVAHTDVTAAALSDVFRAVVEAAGATLAGNAVKKLDLGSMKTDRALIQPFLDIVKEKTGELVFWSAAERGYTDGQLLAEATGSPVVCYGPDGLHTAHTAEEYTTEESLRQVTSVIRKTIERYTKPGRMAGAEATHAPERPNRER